MHFWGIFSMLLLTAIFFSCLIAEIVTDWIRIRKEYRRLDRELTKHKPGGLSHDSILYRGGQMPDDAWQDGNKERSRSRFHGWH